MESQPQKDNAPEGQMSTEDLEEPHEGVEYTIDKDGSASVAPGQLESVKDESPF